MHAYVTAHLCGDDPEALHGEGAVVAGGRPRARLHRVARRAVVVPLGRQYLEERTQLACAGGPREQRVRDRVGNKPLVDEDREEVRVGRVDGAAPDGPLLDDLARAQQRLPRQLDLRA